MTVTTLLLLSIAFLGVTLLLTEIPWFAQRPLTERLRPYSRQAAHPSATRRSGESLRQVLGPLAQQMGERISRALGVTDDLSVRLDRASWSVDQTTFRLGQATRAVVALLGAVLVVVALPLPPILSVALVVVAPAVAVLVEEQRLSRAAAERRRRTRSELPVVVEQLGMLLSAGYSVNGALSRLASRSSGVISDDLTRVVLRIRQGLSDTEALAEWATLSDLDAVRRLVAVLSLHGEAGDLGALISQEAHAVREEAHRDLLESIERRAQLVWIPVTVATLVPGLIFLAVPFISAMSQVTGS